jgi:hypothetical protein
VRSVTFFQRKTNGPLWHPRDYLLKLPTVRFITRDRRA